MPDRLGRVRAALQGIAASHGIAIGRVVVLRRAELSYDRVEIPFDRTEDEVARFLAAVETAGQQLAQLRERVFGQDGDAEHYHILEAYELMLRDENLTASTAHRIREEQINAEWALEVTLDDIRGIFQRLEDEVFRERLSDVDFVGERILRNLVGRSAFAADDVLPHHIVVAHALSPVDTAQMLHRNILGLATDEGSRTSHTAIVARALQIPAVVALRHVVEKARGGELAIVDGEEGICILNPTQAEIELYRGRQERAVIYTEKLRQNVELPATTTDDVTIRLSTNIDFREEAEAVTANGADGVGLFRTEFLYLGRNDLPREEEQLRCYRELLQRLHPLPVTIRTLDLGGDKFSSVQAELIGGVGELAGLRAIRLCLRRPEVFRVQLRALLRASVHGRLRILVPFVTCVSELVRVHEVLDEVKAELRSEGHPFDPDVELGAMVETPAAAQIADLLANYVSFLSIGTNDLIQYTFAVARDNPNLTYLYHPLHPALLRLVRTVATAGVAAGVEVAMCGEMAGEPLFARVLLGLGLTELSMVPSAVPAVKEVVRRSALSDCEAFANELMHLPSYIEVEREVLTVMKADFPELLEGLPNS